MGNWGSYNWSSTLRQFLVNNESYHKLTLLSACTWGTFFGFSIYQNLQSILYKQKVIEFENLQILWFVSEATRGVQEERDADKRVRKTQQAVVQWKTCSVWWTGRRKTQKEDSRSSERAADQGEGILEGEVEKKENFQSLLNIVVFLLWYYCRNVIWVLPHLIHLSHIMRWKMNEVYTDTFKISKAYYGHFVGCCTYKLYHQLSKKCA